MDIYSVIEEMEQLKARVEDESADPEAVRVLDEAIEKLAGVMVDKKAEKVRKNREEG